MVVFFITQIFLIPDIYNLCLAPCEHVFYMFVHKIFDLCRIIDDGVAGGGDPRGDGPGGDDPIGNKERSNLCVCIKWVHLNWVHKVIY